MLDQNSMTNEKFNTFVSWIKFLIKKIFNGEWSALATIFFETNSSSFSITKQIPYWKNNNSTNIYQQINGIATGIAIEMLGFEQVVKLWGNYLIRNQTNLSKIHEPFAILENKKSANKIVKKLKNTLIKIKNQNLTSILSVKVNHTFQEILVEKVHQQRKSKKSKLTSGNFLDNLDNDNRFCVNKEYYNNCLLKINDTKTSNSNLDNNKTEQINFENENRNKNNSNNEQYNNNNQDRIIEIIKQVELTTCVVIDYINKKI
ncbi:hypothetical protein Glove_103g266 [Diversispora epigaea]|uniref:Uncharacterized protein n=1 Tax=Diversispora epigaea TaxID=1348612 RepID=A0A397JCH5_9GLOM|nr:hypothetical protein Glove_103g266 [Diversispora epigaea]